MLDYLEFLKYLILSNESFEVKEDIYKKRHFTVDIPSMYGSYHEMKFDALGLTFRLESLVNALFEELVEQIDLSLITKATFFQIYDRLKLFDKALRIEGIHSVELERQLDMLAHSLEARGSPSPSTSIFSRGLPRPSRTSSTTISPMFTGRT